MNIKLTDKEVLELRAILLSTVMAGREGGSREVLAVKVIRLLSQD